MKIKKSDLISTYAQSMGIEAAKDLITKKIKSAALEEKEHYTEEETAKICGELIKEGGLIRIVAQNFVVQLERKRSEEQALLLDNIETQIWYLTDKETYGAVNKSHAEFFGLEKEKLEGKNLYDLLSKEEAEVCIANNREVFEKKKQSHTEEWVKNGRWETRLLSITRTPKIDGKGDVEYAICAAEEITKRKRAEEALRESKERFRALTESTSDWIWEVDENAVYTYTSPKIKELLGYEPEEIIGKTPFDLMTPEGVKRVAAEFGATAEAQKPFDRLENENLHKDGQILVLETSGVPIFDANGNFRGYRGIDRDITERKHREEALRNAEADWRDSFNSLEDVMLIIDRDYNIENINEIGLKLLGKSKEEVIGKKCYQVISGADSPSEECPCMKSWETKKVESLDRYEERFGKYCSIKSSPIFDDNGEIIKFVDLRRDITERKLEEEKVKEACRLREHFLKETSHRIITPVAIIGGNTDLLLESSNLDDAQKEKIRIIRERNEEVQKLVRDALSGKYLEEGEGGEG